MLWSKVFLKVKRLQIKCQQSRVNQLINNLPRFHIVATLDIPLDVLNNTVSVQQLKGILHSGQQKIYLTQLTI